MPSPSVMGLKKSVFAGASVLPSAKLNEWHSPSTASTNNAIVDLTRTFDFIFLHLPLVGTSPRILPQSRACFKSKHRPSLPEFLCALTIAWSGRAKARVYGDAAAGSHYQAVKCPALAKTKLERGPLGVTAPSVPVEPCVWSAKLGHDRFYCTGAQLLSGLNSVIAFASVAVSFPRSFSYTTPFWLIMKVVMPVSPYFSG